MKTITLLLLAISHFSVSAVGYRVTIESNWSVAEHFGLPNNGHFSPVVAVAHNGNYNLLPIGQKSSKGLESVAELGRTTGILGEVNKARTSGFVDAVVETKNQFVLRQDVQTFEVNITAKHPYLSFVSMIAPSPDWIIGMSALRLHTKGLGFSEGIEARALYALDAGTEDGDRAGNFSINNNATLPQGVITHLTGDGFNSRFATVTIERIHK